MSKTIYVPPGDEEVWKKARRLLPFYLDLSLSEFIMLKIRAEVARIEKEEGKQ